MGPDKTYPHVTFNTKGRPCIDGTRHRIIDIAADHVAHGYSAAQIVEHYPDLNPAQVHAALAYCYDHQDAMDVELMASYSDTEHLRQQHSPPPKLAAARARQAGGFRWSHIRTSTGCDGRQIRLGSGSRV